jgi:hypothetical protein
MRHPRWGSFLVLEKAALAAFFDASSTLDKKCLGSAK